MPKPAGPCHSGRVSRADLADFLRRRRESLHPDRVPAAVDPPGKRARRTPGLRREEVAAQAGISVNYYERLEQARVSHPSPEVLGALSAALRLTDAEREHMARLAGQIPPATAERRPVPAETRHLLDQLGPIPAYLVDERQDIVAWNDAAVALITDFGRIPAEDRNALKLPLLLRDTLCSAPPGEEGEFVQHTAAQLRTASARYPTDRALSELINELASRSPDFAAAWRDHDVRPRTTLRKRLHHPRLGVLDFDLQTLLLAGSNLQLVMYTATPNTPAAQALTPR